MLMQLLQLSVHVYTKPVPEIDCACQPNQCQKPLHIFCFRFSVPKSDSGNQSFCH